MNQPLGDDHATEFVKALQALDRAKDRGPLAALRRGLGKPPGTAPEMHSFVVPWLPKQAGSLIQDEPYYLVAALFALHPKHGPNRSFGASMRGLGTEMASGGAERYFRALLAAAREDLPEHLRRCVSLLKANEVVVDWAQLLRHLRAWDAPDGWVQRRWARDFWATDAPGAEPEPQDQSTAATTAASMS